MSLSTVVLLNLFSVFHLSWTNNLVWKGSVHVFAYILTASTPSNVCVWSKPESGFPSPYVMVSVCSIVWGGEAIIVRLVGILGIVHQ